MTIRSYRPGDDVAQVSIYNEAAGELPKFKAATLDEVRRRARGADFDPSARFVAEAGGRPVGYATFHANGRVSYPWCRKGHEDQAEPLFDAVLGAMKGRGLPRAFAAYRADWPAQLEFFQRHGFRQVREMVNFVLDLGEMPTPAARTNTLITPLTRDDLSVVLQLATNLARAADVAALERYFFDNPWFPPDSAFALRSREGGPPLAVGVLVVNPGYADPRQVDAGMPCFRLGAFGTEGMQVKRINGLFSFLAPADGHVNLTGLNLLGYAAFRLEDTPIDTFGAQVPSDAEHLLRFYKQFFRRQGSFPVFEREL